ncbi:MAG: EAL domain-containing protein [Clostridia bacterium]|nr:EAL domain-containing protein [Clostridia bacterium]MDD4386169.1 EAL domain-containing protein [Clostridia bacterium]
MQRNEGLIDMETMNINAGIEDAKEETKINNLIASLYATSDSHTLTEIYSNILSDDNVLHILNRVSMEQCFLKHFPEFYVKNKYGENVINCMQNSTYHRYGVFKHILTTIEEVGKYNKTLGDSQRKILNWTMLLHDIGKPFVKVITDKNTESFEGHGDMSAELAQVILCRFSFTEEEQHLILTLIKYHDKFLNEGEITYDNLKLLAEELGSKRELFYMLIDVKDADAAAKSIEVYNRYKLTKSKYIDFANVYFQNMIVNSKTQSNIVMNVADIVSYVNMETIGSVEDLLKDINSGEISKIEYDKLIEDVLNKKRMCPLYQPIIDVLNQTVYGYEVLTKIEYSQKVDTDLFLRYAADTKRYDKLQQNLFTNCIDSFVAIHTRESNKSFINVNLSSYQSYVNKPRIYDAMNKIELILEFHGYEKYDFTSLQEIIVEVHKNNGKVLLDHFGIGIFKVDDMKLLTPDYIKLDRSLVSDLLENENKQKYIMELQTLCLVKDIALIAVGVETKEIYLKLKSLGIRYMQGFFLAYPSYSIDVLNHKLPEILNYVSEDSIV